MWKQDLNVHADQSRSCERCSYESCTTFQNASFAFSGNLVPSQFGLAYRAYLSCRDVLYPTIRSSFAG